jgi:hypothetical protein
MELILLYDALLLLYVIVILLSIFELQRFLQNLIKKEKSWGFAVCKHTTKKPNVLCCVLAHGKGATHREHVLMGGYLPT